MLGRKVLHFCCDIVVGKYTNGCKLIKFGKDLACYKIFVFKNNELMK